jgi:hypothetical protein
MKLLLRARTWKRSTNELLENASQAMSFKKYVQYCVWPPIG